jgi:hypothetical protein
MNLNRPLKYLIGSNFEWFASDPKFIVECGYDGTKADIAYCNLFDEKNSGQYGPYKHDSDTAADYGEGEIDPSGPGWEKNLRTQFERRQRQRFRYIELDNPDAYSIDDILGAIDLASAYGLDVIAKNPGLLAGESAIQYVQKCKGIIVEKDAGTPDSMAALRHSDIPVWFVAFGDGLSWIQNLDVTKHPNMYKSYSRHGEYTDYEEL